MVSYEAVKKFVVENGIKAIKMYQKDGWLGLRVKPEHSGELVELREMLKEEFGVENVLVTTGRPASSNNFTEKDIDVT